MKTRASLIIVMFFLASGCLAAEKKAEFPTPEPVLNVSVPQNLSITEEIQLINDTLEIDNKTGEPVINESLDDENPSWSPDGNWIVFESKKAGNWDIWLMDSKGNNLKQLTFDNTSDLSPSFSPDGRKIAFERHKYFMLSQGKVEVGHGIWIMDSDGENMKEIVSCEDHCMSPSWSPDGSKIAYASGGDIWEVDLNKNIRKQLTSGTAIDLHPSWSPDGNRIAYVSTESGDTDIWVMDRDGSNRRQLTSKVGLDFSPSWSPDGKWIVFNSHSDIWVMGGDGSDKKALKESLFVVEENPSWSPDGSKIAFDSDKAGSKDIWVLILKT